MSGRRPPRAPRAATVDAAPGGPAVASRAPLDRVTLVALAVAALAALTLVSDPIADPDLGQHLTVGRAIWETRAIPATELWSWPAFGQPAVTPSWLFRALLWPCWALGGVAGLYLWRALVVLAVGAFGWAAARRMGAGGVVAAVALLVGVVGFRQRTQLRPETLAFVLLAAELWLLARARGGDRRAVWALPAVALVWANAHISYWIGLAVVAIHGLDALLDARAGRGRDAAALARDLTGAGLAMGAASFLNPFGWRVLAQPFEYAFGWSHEPIFRSIGELARFDWSVQWRFLTPLVLVGWPLVATLRAARSRRADRVEWLLMALMVALTLTGQRFVGFLSVAAAPFLARGLGELACRALPAAAGGAVPRLAAAAVAAVALTVAPLLATGARPDPGFDESHWPVAACDFMERHGVRGRSFSQFGLAGYPLWRFGAARDRLPFMDIHQSGGPARWHEYMAAHADPRAWRALDDRDRFDYVLLGRRALTADSVLAFLDRDPAFALVFVDDVTALYVRRDGPPAEVARRLGFATLRGSRAATEAMMTAAARDTALARAMRAECERAAADSRWNARTLRTAAFLDLSAGRLVEGERLLRRVLEVDPAFPMVHGWLGQIARERGDHAAAVREFATERRLHGASAGLWYEEGCAWARAGDRARAAHAFREELRRDPSHAAARDSLAALEAAGR